MKTRTVIVTVGAFILSVITPAAHACSNEPIADLRVREYAIVDRPVAMDGSQSFDPQGPDLVKYEWDFDNDQTFDYFETANFHPDGNFDGVTSYAFAAGDHTVALRVTDVEGLTGEDSKTIHVSQDSDTDDLPNQWETTYGGNLDWGGDIDSPPPPDGYNNLCEYLHGTDPTDPDSFPEGPEDNITIYVPADVSTIQKAIDGSIDGDTIVVAPGTYNETVAFNGRTITLRSTQPDNWDVVEATVIAGNGTNPTIKVWTSEGPQTAIQGLTITNGNRGIYCQGTSPTISNCIITGNNSQVHAGGIYCHDASPAITDCIIKDNQAVQYGGGIACRNSLAVITDCVITGNSAGNYGGGLEVFEGSAVTIENCVIAGNSAVYFGGGLEDWDSESTIINCTITKNDCSTGGGMSIYASDTIGTNCILWGNTDSQLYKSYSANPVITYCCIQDYTGGGEGNITTYPEFFSIDDPDGPDDQFYTIDDGLNIRLDSPYVSPCIDAAYGTGAPSTDIIGRTRIDNVHKPDGEGGTPTWYDMGAYEAPMVWFVDKNASGDDNGSSWTHAYNELHDALSPGVASADHEIWVAKETYKPGTTRSSTFTLVDDVGVYGGFDATEYGRYQRDWENNTTTLSGNIGSQGISTDNTYHVVTGADNAILDGFTVAEGYADGSNPHYYGGGIDNYNKSPTVRNCEFIDNYAKYGGSGMNNYSYASPTIRNCLFKDNTGGYSVGMRNYFYCSPIITDCKFVNNNANYSCGGIYVAYRCDPLILRCAFGGNTAGFYAGAMYIYYQSSPTLLNCVFSENEAVNYNGGAAYITSSTPFFLNCTFSGNTAGDYGGAIYNAYSNVDVTNSILWGDDAGMTGDEVYDYTTSSTTTITYSDIEGGWIGSGSNNIDENPHFADSLNPDGLDDIFMTLDDGLRILRDTGCVDAANGYIDPPADIIYLARLDVESMPNNGPGTPSYVDMGAYESGHDSDNDDMYDEWEVQYDLNPGDSDDRDLDSDGDDLTNIQEYEKGTKADNPDTDGDGMSDGWEVLYGLDPTNDSDASGHNDGDGLTNLEEFQLQTDPTDNDTDDDTINDNLDDYPSMYNVTVTIVYERNDAGDIEKETIQDSQQADVAVTEYKYNELGQQWRVRRWKDAGGLGNNDIVTLTIHDVLGNVHKTIRKVQDNTDYTQEQNGDLVTKNIYDPLGRLDEVSVRVGDPDTYEVVADYDYYDGGQLETVTDGDGYSTTHYYDDAGRLQKVVNAELHYTEHSYNSLNQLYKQIDYNKLDVRLRQTRMQYDGVGNVILRAIMADADALPEEPINLAVDMVTEYHYDRAGEGYPGLLAEEKVHYGNSEDIYAKTLYDYDGLGRRIKTTDPDDNQSIVGYDIADRVVRRQQILDNPVAADITVTTDYQYDTLSRVRKEIRKPNLVDATTWETTLYEYNALDKITCRTKPNGKKTTYHYDDDLGQIDREIADDGGINQKTEYGYDRLGRQTSITAYANDDAQPQVPQLTEYKYDRHDRIEKIIYPDGDENDKFLGYSYTTAGRVQQRIDQNGDVTVYNYDYFLTDSKVIKTATKDSVTAEETFIYDGLGRLDTATKVVDSEAVSVTDFEYDDNGTLEYTTETLFGTSKTITYNYDQAGNLEQITYPGSIGTVNIEPDWQGRIKSLDAGQADIVTYEYMADRTAQRRYPTAGVTYQPVYGTFGRITSANSGEDYAKFDYTYKPNTDNIDDQTYVHRDGDPAVAFTYDGLDRLTDVSYGMDDPVTNEHFVYDDLGNRDLVTLRDTTSDDYQIDPLTNRYVDIDSGPDLVYDNAGNLILDQNGYGYVYDYENRIIEVTKNGGATTVAEFAYDALGRRIRKIADSVTTLYYHNNNWQVLAETDSGGTTQRWYIYGDYIDEPLRMTDSASGDSYYYVHDHLYSPVALVDEDGEVVERYEYDAYGNCHIYSATYAPRSSSLYGNPYLFTGRRVDMLDSGGLKLQYNRNRYYDQYTGRWYTHDPLGITPNAPQPNTFGPIGQYADGMNLYEYVSNPLALTDPMGLSARLKNKTLSALREFETEHSSYEYYWVTGMRQLVNGKLFPSLDWLDDNDYKVNEDPQAVAWYDPFWNDMHVSESDPVPPITSFHEAIHVYNDRTSIKSWRMDEGMAWAAQLMADNCRRLQPVEDEIGKTTPSIDRLRKEWGIAWHFIGGGVLGHTLEDDSTINVMDVARVDAHLDFLPRCGAIAYVYNTIMEQKKDACGRFVCTIHKETPCDIPLRYPLHFVFR